jgi:hypothetical protein
MQLPGLIKGSLLTGRPRECKRKSVSRLTNLPVPVTRLVIFDGRFTVFYTYMHTWVLHIVLGVCILQRHRTPFGSAVSRVEMSSAFKLKRRFIHVVRVHLPEDD